MSCLIWISPSLGILANKLALEISVSAAGGLQMLAVTPTHTLPGYIHGSWQSEMWVLVLAQQGLHLLVISTDIFSNTFLLPPPAITYCFSPCQNCSKVLAKCWLVQLKHLPLEIFLSGENNFFLLVVGHIGLWLLL